MAGKRDRPALKAYQPLVVGLLTTCLTAGLVTIHRTGRGDLPGFEAAERRTLDLRFELRGPRPTGGETVIVVFDNRTLAERPQLFESRDGWAEVVKAVAAQQPKAIGIDAFFADKEQVLPADLLRDIDAYLATPRPTPESTADKLLGRVQAEGKGDERLIAALREAKNVVLGIHMGVNAGRQSNDPSLGRGKYGQSVEGPYQVHEAHDILGSAPMFTAAARGIGMMTVHEDTTQAIRTIPLVRRYHDSYFTTLAVQLVAFYKGLSRGNLAYLGSDSSVRIGTEVIPLGENNGILLNFLGPTASFPTYSAVDVLRGTIPAQALRDRIVLLALTHLGHDTTRTSFGNTFPGVEIHATAIDNLLHGDWLRRAPFRTDGILCFVLGSLIALLFAPRLRLPPLYQAVLAFVFINLHLLLAYFLFARRGLWISCAGPILTYVVTSGTCLAAAYTSEGLQRRRLRRAFAHYLSDGVISELMANPSALSLGGARRNLSVLFSDIRNFTTLSEKQTPEQLIKFLNTYLTPMTRAVLKNGGFLDKFIGDAVMGVFGAPVPDAHHPASALRCVLDMHRALAELQPAVKELIGAEITIGVGINSGDIVVGNMGSDERFNYTVAGDAVNLSSRLEGLTKVYGVFCLIGENTRQAAQGDFTFREVDLVQVKGKDLPVAIFELLGGNNLTIAAYENLPFFEAGVAAYRAGRFKDAREAFTRFAAENPHDKVTPLYFERLATHGDVAPEGWSGVYTHTSK